MRKQTTNGVAYISGPMRKHKGCNFSAFDAAKRIGRSQGWRIISPADMDRRLDGDSPAEHENCDPPFDAEISRRYALRDSQVIFDLSPTLGDAIALLPGWETSTGALAELALAKWLGLAVLDARTFLPLEVSIIGKEHRPPLPPQFQSCTLDDGLCGLSSDLETRSLKMIAEDFANRKEI